MEEQIDFDFNEILSQYRSGKRLTGKDGLLAPLIKQPTEAALEAEVESHIADKCKGKILNFIHSKQNIIINGKTGTGKSWLAQAFANRAIFDGFRVYYISTKEFPALWLFESELFNSSNSSSLTP